MSATSLSHPAGVLERLEGIERELAEAENAFEAAAMDWFRQRRFRANEEARAYVKAEGTDTARRLVAKDIGMATGWEAEAKYEIAKSKIRTLSDRSTIGMSILRAQAGR